jgi:hypothetical protein
MSFTHARREISSFVSLLSRPYLERVKKERKREREVNMFKIKGNYPTPEELYALEQWARRERSKAAAQLILAGASRLKSFVARILAPSATTVRRHVVHHA